MLSLNEKKWGTYCHVAAFAGLIFPLGNIIAPLVIWMLKKDEYQFVEDQGKEVLNFQITAMLALFIAGLLIIVFIGYVLMMAIVAVVFIYTIKGIVKTSEGQMYKYPFSIQFIK